MVLGSLEDAVRRETTPENCASKNCQFGWRSLNRADEMEGGRPGCVVPPEGHDDHQGNDGALQEALTDAGLLRDDRWRLQERNPKLRSGPLVLPASEHITSKAFLLLPCEPPAPSEQSQKTPPLGTDKMEGEIKKVGGDRASPSAACAGKHCRTTQNVVPRKFPTQQG